MTNRGLPKESGVTEEAMRESLTGDEESLSIHSIQTSILSDKSEASKDIVLSQSFRDVSSQQTISSKSPSKNQSKLSPNINNQSILSGIQRNESTDNKLNIVSKKNKENYGSSERRESKGSINSKVTEIKEGSNEEVSYYKPKQNISSNNLTIDSAQKFVSPKLTAPPSKQNIQTSRDQIVLTEPLYNIIKAKKIQLEEVSKSPKRVSYIPNSNDASVTSLEITDETEVKTEVEIVNNRFDILKYLRDVPDISDISETSFDDDHLLPSTGQEYGFSELNENSLSKTGNTYSGELEANSSISKTTTISSTLPLDNLIHYEQNSISFQQHSSRDIFKTLTNIKICPTRIEKSLSRSEYEKHQSAIAACDLFLTEVINRVVAHAEQSTVLLTRQLDKNKMHLRLTKLVQSYIEEKEFSERLEKVVTDYFQRKKRYSFIKKSKGFDLINYQRFRRVLIDLDKHLEIKKRTKIKTTKLVTQLREEFEDVRQFSQQKVHDLEQYMKEVLLQNEGFYHLKSVVKSSLQSMNTLRNTISEMRMELFYAQHLFADIQLKSDALENLGHGLQMHNYLSTLGDTDTLSAKIRERDVELNRLHLKINFDIHALAHLKCKEAMNRKSCYQLKSKLKKNEMLNCQYRDLIYKGRIKHNNYVREISKIKSAGSLHYFPILMEDFDETSAEILLKRQAVEKLREEYNQLTKRISHFETLFATSRSRSKISLNTSKTQ